MELDRHNRIVEKGRNYLSMCLVLIGIILASVNFIFRDSSLVAAIPNWTLTTILISFIFSILLFTTYLFIYFWVSFIHSYYWFDSEDITFVPSEVGEPVQLYHSGQIISVWDKITELISNNKKLVACLKWASIISVVGIISLITLVTLIIYTFSIPLIN